MSARVDTVEFRVFELETNYRTYQVNDHAAVQSVLEALLQSCHPKGSLSENAFLATSITSEVRLLKGTEELATIKVPEPATKYHGPKFGRIFDDAAKRVK